ncbi:LacI family DNA-binding transcriptional regulator [Microbacterium neungamense]|uniref:LacI family DNA-binding transcriptional regulator n=1 Tax=Microbacterium neungamense TaxID=2810535 RepID=UPI00217EF9CA|nr:LacI family DNA-binding transcriptional regulator [Microbacterium neungamense]
MVSDGRRVSMAQVAARAGVSGQTVSRVVNGSPRVDPATRARVEEAMAELGYRPHRAARALRTGRSHTIGLVVTTLATVGNSRTLQGVAETAAERGYALTVVTAGPTAAAIDGAFDTLRDQGVDGLIVLNEASALLDRDRVPGDLRLVVIDAPHGSPFRSVQSDHADGAAAATGRLLALGHPSVDHLAGPEGSYAAAERERGWRETLERAGIPAPPVVRGDWSADSGYAAASALATAGAVFCANDQMALGLIRGLTESGRRVPEDVSVVGFDDVPDAANYRPPLTTVRQDFTALARTAVAALVADIEAAPAPAASVIPTELVLRESAAAASFGAAVSPHPPR